MTRLDCSWAVDIAGQESAAMAVRKLLAKPQLMSCLVPLMSQLMTVKMYDVAVLSRVLATLTGIQHGYKYKI